MKYLLSILYFTLFSGQIVYSTTYYVDPNIGNINNDGSASSPWSTLEEIANSNMIESYSYLPLPYDPATSQLVIKNQDAVIQAGDTLLLRSGLHGSFDIRGFYNSDYITIMADEDHTPILQNIDITAAKNWKFAGLTVSPEPYGLYIGGILVYFESHNYHGPTSKIHIEDCHIYSSDTPWATAQEWLDNVSTGIHAKCDSIEIINNLIRNVDHGINNTGDNIHMISNQIINFAGDGMRLQGSNLVAENNIIKNCYDIDDNHDDGMQSFTTPENPFTNNIIRANIIINYEDPNQPLRGNLQGIGCFDGFYNDWIIENNLVFVDHYHGITLSGANNCKIINNTVIDPSPDASPGPTWIRIGDHKNGTPSSGCVVKNNIANSFQVDGTLSHNSTLTTYTDYATHFVDYLNRDFHLLPTSTLIDAADVIDAPNVDLDGTIRPQGIAPDIGCYEYPSILSDYDLLAEDLGIELYPNPTSGEFNIKGELSKYNIFILNDSGTIHSNISTLENQVLINLTSLPPGLFFVKIQHKTSNALLIQKIIKI